MSDLVEIAGFESIEKASFANAILHESGIFTFCNNLEGQQLLYPINRLEGYYKIKVNELDSQTAISILIENGLINNSDTGPDKVKENVNKMLSTGTPAFIIYKIEQLMFLIFLIVMFIAAFIFLTRHGGGKF